MGIRRNGRELALQVLFQVDVGGLTLEEIYRNFWRVNKLPEEARDFTFRISSGVIGKLAEIDGEIKKYARNWDISRINSVDRTILRMAIYELLFCSDIPYKVSINEAIEIAKKYGTSESGKFINGILDRVARENAKVKKSAGGKKEDEKPEEG